MSGWEDHKEDAERYLRKEFEAVRWTKVLQTDQGKLILKVVSLNLLLESIHRHPPRIEIASEIAAMEIKYSLISDVLKILFTKLYYNTAKDLEPTLPDVKIFLAMLESMIESLKEGWIKPASDSTED